jgi:hypothetical protein
VNHLIRMPDGLPPSSLLALQIDRHGSATLALCILGRGSVVATEMSIASRNARRQLTFG